VAWAGSSEPSDPTSVGTLWCAPPIPCMKLFPYRGLRARGLKGRHIEAFVAEWRRQGLADGTMNPSWSVRKILFHQYVEA